VDVALLVLAGIWLVAVGFAAVRAALAARRLGRTVAAGGAARLEALVALDRRREHLTDRQTAMLASLVAARETGIGAQRGVRVLGILGDALREAAGRR
jgi:hypothetical protein